MCSSGAYSQNGAMIYCCWEGFAPELMVAERASMWLNKSFCDAVNVSSNASIRFAKSTNEVTYSEGG